MAVDVCTDISSPRISFSYDLTELENLNRRTDPLLSNPTVDFDFCIFPHQISSADELFANGRILPVQIKQIRNPSKDTHHHHQQSEPALENGVVSGNGNTKKKKLVEFLLSSNEEEDDEIEKPSSNSKTFWQFRRNSSSAADGENGRSSGLLRLRSLQFLTRSNSTGSVPSPKAIQKQHSLREGSVNCRYNSSVSSAFNHYYYPYNNNISNSINNNSNNNTTSSNKPYLKKSTSRSYGGNGIRINPVLNIPPAYIAKGTASLFGSFFGSKKSKKR